MTHKNYYTILGVSKDATPDAIRKAYRTLARRYHPDTSPKGKQDAARFQELTEAYQTLSDADKRAAYDRDRYAPASATTRAGQAYGRAYTSASPHYQEAEPEPTGPIHSTQASPKDVFAGATLFILAFACVFMVFGFSQLVNVLAGDGGTSTRRSTLTVGEWRQVTQQVRQTATARAYPTPAPVAEQRITRLNAETLLAGDSPSCVLDLVRNHEDCRSIPQLGLPAFYNGSAVLRIDLDPRTYSHTRVVLVVTYGDAPMGLSVNISDNATSDGSHASSQRNAELVVMDTYLTVYGRVEAPSEYATLASRPDLVRQGQTLILEVGDQLQGWATDAGGERMASRYLYALGGQPDGYGDKHYTVYAAFNRPIRIGATPDQFGGGVTRVEVWLLTAD